MTAPTIAELAAAREVFTHALRTGDAEGVSAAYADEAKLLAPSTELVEGRPEIEAFWRAGIESGIAEFTLEPTVVEEREGIAYEIGTYRLALGTGENRVVDEGRYALVHERAPDGSWQRTVEMFNPNTQTEKGRKTR
jgi:ketosteroid isomerase-like protein